MRQTAAASTGQPLYVRNPTNGNDNAHNSDQGGRTNQELEQTGRIAAARSTVAALAPADAPEMEESMTVMSVVYEGNQIAFAAYNEDQNDIVMEHSYVASTNSSSTIVTGITSNTGMNSVAQTTAYQNDMEHIVEGVIQVIRPNLILVGNKIAANPALLQLITKPPPKATTNQEGGTSTITNSGSNNDASTIPYRLVKSSAFDIRKCRSLILQNLRVLTLLRNQNNGNNRCSNMNQQGNHRHRHRHRTQQQHQYQHQHHNSSQQQYHYPTVAPSPYHALASIIDFDSSIQVRAIGSLLSFLQETIFRLEEGGTITIGKITHHSENNPSYRQFMRINDETLRALHIFRSEHHPLRLSSSSTSKSHTKSRTTTAGSGGGGGGNTKEGFSLFSLLDRTHSKMGRQTLREWFLKPLLDIGKIQQRYNGIDLFLLPKYQTSVGVLLNNLRQIGSVGKILGRMQKCHTSSQDFLILSKTLSAAMAICQCLQIEFQTTLISAMDANISHRNDGNNNNMNVRTTTATSSVATKEEQIPPSEIPKFLEFIQTILERCYVPILSDLYERITSIVDHDLTTEATKQKQNLQSSGGSGSGVVIQTGFHEELDNAKEQFEHLDETLSSVASQIFERHQGLIHLEVLFLPQVGFLISLDKRQHAYNDETNKFPNIPEDFEHVFNQDHNAFFKNTEMREMDEDVGDLDAYITDTENMIVSELEEDILDCETELRSTFSALAELDCVLAFAACAADLKFTRPTFVSHQQRGEQQQQHQQAETQSSPCVIHIVNGRHPLQELIIDGDFVANGTNINVNNRVNIITGPNFSGKSCYTRQVGILVYMAQIGCFLPCDSAALSITDQIFARISSTETCAVPQSTFQLDLTQMATILRRSTPSTLVLVDEFGKGTNPASGIALLTAAMRKLVNIKCKCICTTHFLEIFSLGLLKDGQDGIKVLRMAMHLPNGNPPMQQNDGDNNGEIAIDCSDGAAPLFRLEDGIADSSAGFLCAKAAGVNPNVIRRSIEIVNALRDGTSVQPLHKSMYSLTDISSTMKNALRMFLGIESWKSAAEQDLHVLNDKLSGI